MARKKRAKAIDPVEEPMNVAESAALESTPQTAAAVSTQERIALLAYAYWEQRGRAGGSAEEDWFRAEREILSRMNAFE